MVAISNTHPESREVKHDHPDDRLFLSLDPRHNSIVKLDTINR